MRGRENGQIIKGSVRIDGGAKKKVHHGGGIDIIKDETNPRSKESGRHKRQALADRKDTDITRQCMGERKMR